MDGWVDRFLVLGLGGRCEWFFVGIFRCVENLVIVRFFFYGFGLVVVFVGWFLVRRGYWKISI